MYCGTKVQGCPKSISEHDVVFSYYRNDKTFYDQMMSTTALTDDLRTSLLNARSEAFIYTHLRKPSRQLLTQCGFEDVVVYRDLDWTDPRPFDSDGDDWFDESSDFFTYLARKPRASGQ